MSEMKNECNELSSVTGSAEDMPCPECGKRGYVPHDALWAIRCSDGDCKFWQVPNVLTRKQWIEKQNNTEE